MALVMTAVADRDPGRARVDLQPGRARLHRDAVRVHVPVEQQRQRVRRLRRDDVLDDVRDDCALLRPLLPAARRARDRRLARGEEGRPRFGRDVPHRRRDLRDHAARGHRAHRRSDDPARAHARPDRRRADALMLRALLASVLGSSSFTVVLGFGYPALMTGFAQVTLPHQANGSLIERRRQGRRLVARRAGLLVPGLLPRAAVGDLARVQPRRSRPSPTSARRTRRSRSSCRRTPRRSSSSRARTTPA